jgi:UDP-N-acetylglucosamine 2-epimerase (non-hydrolysing)/GDP/UDP-N,N'-diacetylbacillosamine 2-epimerase (hydrolysing)
MRTIAIVSGTRADYGLYLPILRRLSDEQNLKPAVIACGMHLAPDFGLTVGEIERDGFGPAMALETLLAGDTGASMARSAGMVMLTMPQALETIRPHILLVLGDRGEMLAAALAALHMNVPVAHIHGGECTFGAVDDSIRHALTMISHLHFVATDAYARRVQAMGEEPWRITVSGAPGLDNLRDIPLHSRQELAARLEIPLDGPLIMLTFHPVTREPGDAVSQATNVIEAACATGARIVATYPNADAGGRTIADLLLRYATAHPRLTVHRNLGQQTYLSLMRWADVMLGNSSSGIIEAPSLGLPVVNVGTRQEGRVRAANVLDVGYAMEEVADGLLRALTDEAFIQQARSCVNPYGDGHAAERIVAVLRDTPLDQGLLTKRMTH